MILESGLLFLGHTVVHLSCTCLRIAILTSSTPTSQQRQHFRLIPYRLRPNTFHRLQLNGSRVTTNFDR